MKSRNFSHYWCGVMIDRLIQHGCDHFFVAPGSRSTPLVSAIVRHEKAHVVQSIDERSLAFMALGYAKVKRIPTVIVVTSGTAVANLLPAVVEAHASCVPLIILSADRPYELRDSGANQTIIQPYIFSHYALKNFDLSPPSPNVSIKKSEAIFDQAVHYACGARPGPVHINTQFREPLNNVSDGEDFFEQERLFPPKARTKIIADLSPLKEIFNCAQGLLVVGELTPSLTQRKIIALAERLEWPIFADVSSNLRFCDHPLIVHHFDVALLNHKFVSALNPEVVVHIGDRMVSKRYWSFVEKNQQSKFFRLSQFDHRIDHTGHMEQIFVGDLEHAIDELMQGLLPRPFMMTELFDCYKNIIQKIPKLLEQSIGNNEAFFAHELVRAIPEEAALFISSSMPIRDVDQWASVSPFLIDVFVNRGASGIDGVVSSALGVCLAAKKPTILLIGDVAFLHDTNGLMAIKQSNYPLLIIVINNNGGGIFHFLPISQERDVVTPFLDTPHSVDIKYLCKAHGVNYCVGDDKNFSSLVKKFFEEKNSMVLEVKIERDTNVMLHKKMYQCIENY